MLRRFLTWVIIALLPVQGYAAALMISCGPMHAEMAAAAAGYARGNDSHDHDHGAHHHPGTSSSPDVQDDELSFGTLGKFKCSACASCCTAPAVPASPGLSFAVAQVHAELIPFYPTSEGWFVPDGLERPPRHFLA